MRNRPFGVSLISILMIIDAIIGMFAAFAMLGLSVFGLFDVPYIGTAVALSVIGIFVLLITIIELVVAAGLWSLEKWAWIVAVIVCWIDIIFGVISGIINVQTFSSVLLGIIIPLIVLFYLYSENVRKSFDK